MLSDCSPYRRKEVIGNATLYLGDCYQILPHLGFIEKFFELALSRVQAAYSQIDMFMPHPVTDGAQLPDRQEVMI